MRTKRRKRRRFMTSLVFTLILVAVLSTAVFLYFQSRTSGGIFLENTTINGYEVSELTTADVERLLLGEYGAQRVRILEKGETARELSLDEMGYVIDEAELAANIQGAMRSQNSGWLFSLMIGNEFTVDIPFVVDEAAFEREIASAKLAAPRVRSENASLEYDGEKYYIKPEVYGNEMDDRRLQALVRDALGTLGSSIGAAELIEVTIPESIYLRPETTKDDPELNTELSINNTFCMADIHLLFGDQEERLDWSLLQGWITREGDRGVLREDLVYEYVENLAARYNTLYYQRDFTTTMGSVVHFDSSDYGYRIDQDAEAQQLIADIYSNTEVSREPIYAVRGYSRSGRDDLNGCYVEVNLTMQHLWFYMNGGLVIESDFVSGLPKDERETVTGIFPLAYKQSPSTLKGGDGANGYETEVQYWMPFHDGQGLHDAWWRSSFGGSIYLTNGSHGCVNLPSSAAQVIYEHIETNVPIILYK